MLNIFYKMRKFFTVFFILFSQVSFTQTRIYSNEFLAIGVGARASAMSNSVIASCESSEGGYWNPATLSSIYNKYEISAMHSEYFAEISKFDYLGFAYKIDDSLSIGISAIRFGTDDILNTLELIDENGDIDYDRITKFSVADYAFLFSYSKISKIPGLQYGGNVKIIYRKQGEFATAYGFGFDIAGRYKKKNWLFGANLRDATSTFNAWIFNTELLENTFNITNNDIPENSLEIAMPQLLTGFARKFVISKKFNLLTELDFDISFDGKKNVLITSKALSIAPHFGFELDYKNIIFFRAGVGNFAMIPDFDKDVLNFQPNIGLGVNLYDFSLQYSLANVGSVAATPFSNVISMSYGFSKFKKK